MNTNFLRNYIKLAQYKSFSELAEAISISQSTLSHQISQLEKEFGVKLIDRTTRTFEITEAGKIVLDYGEKIIELFDNCNRDLNKYSQNRFEQIVISASTFPGSHILPKFITKFKDMHPNAVFNVMINNSRKSMQNLKKNKTDFAGIGSFMKFEKKDFDYIKIGEDKLVFICSPNHKLLKGQASSVIFDDLIQYPYISREKGSGTREVIENGFKAYEVLNKSLEINDNDSIISAVSESNYIALLSEIIAINAENAGLIKIIKVKEYPIVAKREIFFIKLKEKKLSGLKKKFWDYF